MILIFRNKLILIVGLLLVLTSQALAEGGRLHFTGTVTTLENQTIEGMSFSEASEKSHVTEPLKAKIELYIKNQAGVGQSYEVPLEDVAKVIFNGRAKEGRGNFVVVMKNGKSFEQQDREANYLLGKSIYVSSRHPITGALSYARIHWYKIKEIRFHALFGQVRKDELGHTFPADYEFSPFTGRPMQLEVVE